MLSQLLGTEAMAAVFAVLMAIVSGLAEYFRRKAKRNEKDLATARREISETKRWVAKKQKAVQAANEARNDAVQKQREAESRSDTTRPTGSFRR